MPPLCCCCCFISPSIYTCAFVFFAFLSTAMATAGCLAKKARGEEKGLRALSWQMSSVIMPQRRNEAAGGLPSCREQRCQFPVLAAARAWHPYMASQNSSPWLPSVPFRAANRISTHRLVFLFSPPTVPMTSSLLHSAASRVTLLGFLAVVVVVFYFIFFKREKKKRQMHTRHRAQCFR